MNVPRLKMAIAEAGTTQKELAKKMGYSKNTFNLKVNGKIKMNVDEANKLLELLKIDDPRTKVDIFFTSSIPKKG